MRPGATIAADRAAPLARRFRSSVGDHLLVIRHSRIYDLGEDLSRALDEGRCSADDLAAGLDETVDGEVDPAHVVLPNPQSLSLNVSSSCNLSCGYCYADRGSFSGTQSATMTADIAHAAVDRLLDEADPAHPITIGFLGGEPLYGRALIRSVVERAAGRARIERLDVRFSITTNGTLLNESDIELFREHPFAVTISIDGGADHHDPQRPSRNGTGSFARLSRRVAPLLDDPGQARIAARMTVGTGNLDLRRRLEAIWALGFKEAGVTPLRVAADGSGLKTDDWDDYLAAVIEVARGELERAHQGRQIRLTNLAVALKQVQAGWCSPYACSAGGGYFSVASDGDWYACHRAVGDETFRLGSPGVLDEDRRRSFLDSRHVHAQADCRTCWARYLCSGGCHQEAAARTKAGCDFVRGWLDFCLAAYCELSSARPAFFQNGVSKEAERAAIS